MRRNLLAVASFGPAVNQALGPTTLDLTSQDPVLCPKIFVPQQEFLIDRSGDVGHHPRPKHFGFPLDLHPVKARL